jgi:uncharacterized membrane protein
VTDATAAPRRDVLALLLGGFITFAGVMHIVSPQFFDDIVPPWLPPSERFWTYASGVAELAVGPLILWPRTRRIGALAAIGLFIAVYPANLYMVWDWRDRAAGEQFVAWARLPFQFLFIWAAWRVAQRNRRACELSRTCGSGSPPRSRPW